MSLKVKNKIATALFAHREEAQKWFEKKFTEYSPSFYCSVDVRDSGEKVAPVDCNLFPAGWNNICEVDHESASPIFRAQIEKMAARLGAKVPEKILIVPENHTENRYYLENLHFLKTIFEAANFEIEFGRYSDEDKVYELSSITEKRIVEYPTRREGPILKTTTGFTPDWIVLNNDFSQGYPECLDGVSQPIVPSYQLGWHSRKKSTHFEHYNQLAREFAKVIDLDPWHITIESQAVDHVDFNEGVGIDRVAAVATKMFEKLEADHLAHGVRRKPALFIKNDSGTYGIGIMVVKSVEEITNMNRRTKNKMSVGKNKSVISQVLVQEGVPTRAKTDGHTSEPVVYIMGEELIGGFVRANKDRDDMDNLNSQGMYFKKLCFKDLSDSLATGDDDDLPTLEAVYGIVAKLSAVAAAMELKNQGKHL
ncbi:MAG: glutamate--cysteine ligase [Bdellovibrionales bacterium]|nr:glutamate--cysteine ligase [Bdellovibrionales bacterium]